ncbi:hypothetical protein WMF38_06595 [Sorangium sp. So ce118]
MTPVKRPAIHPAAVPATAAPEPVQMSEVQLPAGEIELFAWAPRN